MTFAESLAIEKFTYCFLPIQDVCVMRRVVWFEGVKNCRGVNSRYLTD